MNRHPLPAGFRAIVTTAVVAGIALTAFTLATATVSVLFARAVVTPPRRREQDVRILASTPTTVTLSRTPDSLTPGRYSLWFSADTGHARVGEIVGNDSTSVTRMLLGVDFGDLEAATRGRWSGWFFLSPADLGLTYADVQVPTEFGPAPAWVVLPEASDGRWMIGVHGRAVRREETLRSVPVFRAAGYTSLLISYRNDGDAPSSPDRRYGLGDTEWEDVAAAIRYACAHGATRIVLMGWSMGGATVLQAAMRSPVEPGVVTGLVLESPVVDWGTALDYQGAAYHLPGFARWAVRQLLSRKGTRWLIGQAEAINLGRLDLVTRAAELQVPILLMHSIDDGYVPDTASRALALARPDLVTWEEFTVARHTKLWNYDPDRWNSMIADWLVDLG